MLMPFIGYVSAKHNDRVALYTANKNIPDAAYYHLEYLKTHHKLELKYFFDEQCLRKYRYVFLLHDKIKIFQIKKKATKKMRHINYLVSLITVLMTRVTEYILEKPIKGYVDKLNVSDKIIMHYGGEDSFPYSTIVSFAEKRGINTIGYFQGFYIYSNLQYTSKVEGVTRSIKGSIKNFIQRRKKVYCTYYLAGRTTKTTFFRSNTASDFKDVDRIYETVTPRFTKGWIKTFKTYLATKDQFDFGDKKKINVVFFLSRIKQNIKVKEYVEVFNLLSKLNNINFVYKSHPRVNLDTYKGYNASNINSFLLSAWADVGILLGSSIAIHLLLDNVPIIVPSFVHTNSTILEKHKTCITVKNIGELETILSNNTKDDIRKLVDNTRVDKFLNEHFSADKDYEQIMQEYYEAVVDLKLNK